MCSHVHETAGRCGAAIKRRTWNGFPRCGVVRGSTATSGERFRGTPCLHGRLQLAKRSGLSMSMHAQFMWGLANGVVVLAVAGSFFLGAAAASAEVSRLQWLGLAMTGLGLVLLLLGGARIRRKAAGFRLADLKKGTDPQRRLGRQLSLFFRWIILAEWTLFGVVSFLCHHFHADELTAPLIGLIISLHFAPLAHLFRLPAYYATAFLVRHSQSRRSRYPRSGSRFSVSDSGSRCG